jgi:hypothetical protein
MLNERVIKLRIYEVLDTKEMLRCEFIENYHVLYEKIELRDYEIKDDCLLEKGCTIQKYITIFKGSSFSSLMKIKAYPIQVVDIIEIRKMVANDFPELFKNVQFSPKAV